MKKILYTTLVFSLFSFLPALPQAIVATGVDVHGTIAPDKYSICDQNNNGIECTLTVQGAGTNIICNWTYIAANGASSSIAGTAPFTSLTNDSGTYHCEVFDAMTLMLLYSLNAKILVADNTTFTGGTYAAFSIVNGPCGTSTLSAVPNFWTFYQWQMNGFNIGGANSSTYNATQSGLYRCLLSNSCGICTSPTTQVNVTATFAKPVLTGIGGNNNCSGTGIIRIQTAYVTGTHFKWFDGPTHSWLSSAPDTNWLDVSGLDRYIYVVQYNTCKSDTSLQIHVSASTTMPVVATVNPAGPVSICSGTSTSLGAAYGVYFFNWYKNGVPISGAVNHNLSVNATGNYYVILTDACGNTKSSNTVTVTVKSKPSSTISPQGNTTFCSGGNVLLQANAGNGFTYQWTKFSNPIAGATNQTYTASATSTYKVIVTSQYGCSKTSAGVAVTVNAKPSATITPPGPLTMCAGDSITINGNSGAGLSYQWRKNGNAISGATGSAYEVKTQGTYTLKVTNSNGCTKLSTGCSVTINCRSGEFIDNGDALSISPNPTADQFNFSWAGEKKAQLKVFDVTGKCVCSQMLESNKTFVNGSEWPAGIYMVVLTNGNEVIKKKVIKTE